MSEFKNLISQALEQHKAMIEQKQSFEQSLRDIHSQANKLFLDELKKRYPTVVFDVLTDLSGGKMVKSWDPYFTISRVNGKRWTDQEHWAEGSSDRKTDSPLNAGDLLDALADIGASFGLPCRLSTYHVKTKDDVKQIRGASDVELLYDGVDILEEGNVWVKGWDIPDIFFVCKHEGDYLLLASSNGHGFGIDHVYTKASGIHGAAEFFELILRDKDNLPIRDKFKLDILKAWLH